MTRETYRRLAGLTLGAAMGLAFTGIWHGLDLVLLPGIPLYMPPFGAGGNILLGTGIGALLGLLCAWMEPSVPGILLSAAVGAAFFLSGGMINHQRSALLAAASAIGMIFLWLPFSAMAVLVMAPVRIAVNRLTDTRSEKPLAPERLWLPVVLVIAAGALGYAMVFKPPARTVILRTQDLLQQGLRANNPADLPTPLRGSGTKNFTINASPAYTLSWENQNLTRFAIPRPAGPDYLISVVVARFDNGWNVVCLYPNVEAEPRCKSFNELP